MIYEERFEDNKSYQKILLFGDEELKKKVTAYAENANKRVEKRENTKKLQELQRDLYSLVLERRYSKSNMGAGAVFAVLAVFCFYLFWNTTLDHEFFKFINLSFFIGFAIVGVIKFFTKEPSVDQVNENIQRRSVLLRSINELQKKIDE